MNNKKFDGTYPILYTVDDIKNIFKCGKRQAYELVNSQNFPAFKINSKIYVDKIELEKWLKQQCGKQVII